jgi:hypothetical protein
MLYEKQKKEIRRIEKRIEAIKCKLQNIGMMRPGSLTKQFKDRDAKTGPYYQLSYTHKMKSKTDYVKRDAVKAVKRQVAEYKKFKKLMDDWIELAIEQAKLEAQDNSG